MNTAADQVRVTTRDIDVPEGDSASSGDLTLMNDRVICTFATRTTPPWGMPPGGILDISPTIDGQPVQDLINIFDFLPDNWCSWPNTYHRVQAVEEGPEKGLVRVERDWGQVQLVTDYTLARGDNVIEVCTSMTNASDQSLDILPGYTLYMKCGHMLTPPGLNGIKEGWTQGALTWSFIGYDQHWSIALHAPYLEYIDHFGQDMFGRLSLAPGQTRTVQAWIQVCAHSNISEILRFELDKRGSDWGTLQGRVYDQSGQAVAEPYVIVEKDGHTLTWAQGKHGSYELFLPPGEYAVQATARHYSQSPAETVRIHARQTTEQDFSGLQAPARIAFRVTDGRDQRPLDARIDILRGPTPAIGFLGQNRCFTDLKAKGQADLTVPPGDYLFAVSHGGDFLCLPREVQLRLEADDGRRLDVCLDLQVRPAEQGWFGADMHHHGDVLDGVTSPEFVLRSQLACGLDVALLSDHDSTEKNGIMAELAAERRVPFIPAMEISPAWGHFNIYPVGPEVTLGLSPGTSTAADIFSHARELGAEVVVVNHPYSTYGYFRSLEHGVAPGGYVDTFDLIEINYQYPVDQTVHQAWELWNQNRPVYLTAGTDTHSVWQDTSGAVRMYVHLNPPLTTDAYISALKSGHAFATYGPLVFPEIPFGQEVSIRPGEELRLNYALAAVHRLTEVQLISEGRTAQHISLNGTEQFRQICFSIQPEHDTWCALVVSDKCGNRAFTNPLWVKVAA
ncbi:CehA/McbA family metallohydrolase [Desulfovermiculus halophilus]|jgi:hypothetical protein|uniref:CehA/McbA family metallohydrolase n=1 Tax=Desulfovermiculus halophilus TaxID=339722 RepID=UPI0013788330|nr:CehA/McbA family metallohydrolase [Desulfovermiculus halophilus]